MTQIDGKKRFILQQLRNTEEIFALFSRATRLPYVHCDEESYNDQIYIFRKEEDARKTAGQYQEKKIPVQIMKVQKDKFLEFYSSLYFQGINAMVIDQGENQIEVLLEELVTPPDYSKMPKGQIRVDNPQFQLTAMYLMQLLRREPGVQPTREMQELEEELLVNMRRGTYIVPLQDDKKVPLMKIKEDVLVQPVFTDIHEFNKFGGAKKFRGAVVPYEKLSEAVAEQARGIVINPLSVHVVIMKEQL